MFNYRVCSLLLILLLIALTTGCSLSRDITLSSMAQKKQHHEIIRTLQPVVDRQEQVSSFELLLLGGAYYEIRDYDGMMKTSKLMDRQIARGDTTIYGGDLTVYPMIFQGYVYLEMGEYEKAAKELMEARTHLNRPGRGTNGFYHSQLMELTKALGVAQARLNHDADAKECIETLLGLDEQVLGPVAVPEKYIAIATIEMARKRYRSALDAIRNPRARASGAITALYDQTFQELPRFFMETKCLYEIGQLQEAKEGYEQLLKHPQIKQVGGLYWPALLDRARIARAAADTTAAEALLREAVAVIEKQRASITSEAGRIGYVGDKQDVYEELVSILMAGNRPAEAFEFVERAKGRALVDLLASRKNIAVHGRDAVDVHGRYNELAKTERNLSVVANPADKPDADRTRGVILQLRKELSIQAPEFTSLVSVTGSSAVEIREKLGRDEILIEYYASGREWLVFVLTKAGISARKLGKLDLDQDVRTFRTALTNPSSEDYLAYSRKLYDKLIAPIADLLTSPNLTIIPHGPLHYLPFAALSSGKDYLVDRKNVRVLQTAGVLKFLKKKTREGNPTMLIMGNPDLGESKYDLKYAQQEAEEIAGIIPGATLLLRSEARASALSQRGARFDIIHFAAHALFDPDNPLDSALLLAKEGDGDGLLRAGELYDLNLNAELVTLSACETALGKITSGDDVIGFTRGLLYAGAGSIVSTLWRVDDRATKDLMLDFYTKLLQMGKGEALRQAQLKTKKRYPHPYYWGSFQLTGNID